MGPVCVWGGGHSCLPFPHSCLPLQQVENALMYIPTEIQILASHANVFVLIMGSESTRPSDLLLKGFLPYRFTGEGLH